MPRRNFIVEAWDGLPGWGKAAVGIGTVIVGGSIARKQIKKAQERKRLRDMKKVFEDGKKNTIAVDQQGNITQVTINTATAAATIYDAIYNNDPMGWTEDETRIVNTLQKIPKGFIKDVEADYNKLYKKNLREDVIKALDTDEWEKVQHLFE